jgi:hypothetical protein
MSGSALVRHPHDDVNQHSGVAASFIAAGTNATRSAPQSARRRDRAVPASRPPKPRTTDSWRTSSCATKRSFATDVVVLAIP